MATFVIHQCRRELPGLRRSSVLVVQASKNWDEDDLPRSAENLVADFFAPSSFQRSTLPQPLVGGLDANGGVCRAE